MSCHVMTAILELIEPEIALFEPPTREPYGRTKHEVYVMTRKLAMTIQNFTYHRGVFKPPFWERGDRMGSSMVQLERTMVL